jgi:hypothetical protein
VSAGVEDAIVTATWLTDAGGAAVVGPLPAGEASVAARATGYRKGASSVPHPATDAEARSEVEVRLTLGGVIAGRVTAPAGVPVEAVSVDLSRIEGRRRRGYRNARADASGRFRFDGLKDGTHELRFGLEHDGRKYAAEATATCGDLDLEVALAELEVEVGTRWEIQVLDPTGRPVPLASAGIHFGFRGGNTRSDSGDVRAGRVVFTCADPAPDQVWLEVHDVRDAAGLALEAGALVRAELPVQGGRAEVHLPPAQTIEGVVRSPDGTGVESARI